MTHALSPQGSSVAARAGIDCERRLRIVLRANATSCTISGLALAVAPATIDELLGTGHPGWIRLVGLALLPFAALVFWLSTTDNEMLQRITPVIIAGDIGWVVASIGTALLGWYSGSGVAAVLAMALLVDIFALLQFNAVRHLRRS